MGEDGSWKQKIRQQLSTGPEQVPGLPLVEIAGTNRVLIENHRGVCCYSRDLIRIRVIYGDITISGARLELARMSRERVVITGRIDCVSLTRRTDT